MTVFIAPSPPPAADAGLPAPKLELSPDRSGASFGPALAEARAQLDHRAADNRTNDRRVTDRRDQPSDDSPRHDDRSTQRGRSSTGQNERVDNDDRPADESADQTSDHEVDEEQTVTDGETTEIETETDDTAATDTALFNLLTVQTDHPTAKGADGDGAPSTGPRVEGVASPTIDEADQLGPVDRASDSGLDVDPSLLTELGTADAGSGEAADAGRVSDAGAEDALAGLDDSSQHDLMTAESTSNEHGASDDRGDDTEQQDDTAQLTLTDDAIAEQDQVDATETVRPLDDRSAETVSQTQAAEAATRAAGAERVVVRATEALAAEAAMNPDATSELPSDAAAAADADSQLWRDVRAAFERVKATGESREIRMRLHPAELGELIVQVRTQGDQVSVRLVTSTAAAHQALIDDRLRLASELASAGFDEGTVDIGQQSTSSDQQNADSDPRSFDEPDRTLGVASSLDDRTDRDVFERRDLIPIHTGSRPGRTAVSTINLTL